MSINRKVLGYSVWVRVEYSAREWVSAKLTDIFGDDWKKQIPQGLWTVFFERHIGSDYPQEPADLLEELDFIHLKEIVCYRKQFDRFCADRMKQPRFEQLMGDLYEIRIKLAHVKRSFNALDMDRLIEQAKALLALPGFPQGDITAALESVQKNPTSILLDIPTDFVVDTAQVKHGVLNNLPEPDFEGDGGFIGRHDEIKRLRLMVAAGLHRVITISGAGGVGKTAIALELCHSLLEDNSVDLEAIVWTSAKEEILTAIGIRSLTPGLTDYGSLVQSMASVFRIPVDPTTDLQEVLDSVLNASIKGVLLVVDNLETIQDQRIVEFIKDIPPPHRVLITSRLGLGEVERRLQIKELSERDAVQMFRTVARERDLYDLARLPEPQVLECVRRVACYPLVIKWFLGQVALGTPVHAALRDAVKPAGDVAKFCFDQIFRDHLVDQDRVILSALAIHDSPATVGLLSFATDLEVPELESGMRKLVLASLVVAEQSKSETDAVETRYSLLPLTRHYVLEFVDKNPEAKRRIQHLLSSIETSTSDAAVANVRYKYAMGDLGATTKEEKMAAVLANRAFQLFEAGDLEAARREYKRAVAIAPNFAGVFRSWSIVESKAGAYAAAKECIGRASTLSPNDGAVWFTHGNIEKQHGHLELAIDAYQKAVAILGEEAPLCGALGDVERRRGNFEAAVTHIQRALQLPHPSGRKHEIISRTLLGDTYKRWAESLTKGKDLEGAWEKIEAATEQLNAAVALDKWDQNVIELRQRIYSERAQLAQRMHGFERAKDEYFAAIEPKPKDSRSRRVNGWVLAALIRGFYSLGDVENCRALFDECLKIATMPPVMRREIEELAGASFGRVERVEQGRHFGIIEAADGTGTYLFHQSDLERFASEADWETFAGRRCIYVPFTDDQGRAHAKRVVMMSA